MRIQLLLAVTATVFVTGLGLSVARAQQKSTAANSVVVYKSPT